MATRWRWPPESWCGIAEAELRTQPDLGERLRARGVAVGDAVDGQRLGEDRVDGVARVQRAVGILEHHLHAAANAAVARLGTGRPSMRMRAGR